MTVQTVLLLPRPPSVNNLFPTGKHGKRYASPAYKAWQTEAGYRLHGQPRGRYDGPVRVEYAFARPSDRRRRDLFNLEKALTDLLVSHGILADDCLIEEGTLRWSDAVAEGVRVTIEAMPNAISRPQPTHG